MQTNRATLKSANEYTMFSFEDVTITFLTSKRLEYYTEIKEWDDGYIVVMAKNKNEEPHEDYIDLVPILENLGMNPEEFLKPIKEVEIVYD